MRRQELGASRRHHPQLRRVQRIEVDLTVFANDAELIARHARIPAHVDDRMHAAGELHEHGRGIFDGDAMHGVRQ